MLPVLRQWSAYSYFGRRGAQVESAALLVCLDDDCPDNVGPEGAVARARQMWHGDGVNRFYDKTLQFVVLPDGHAGFLGEHALADGAPTSRLCAEVAAKARSSLRSSSESAISLLAAVSLGLQEIVWDGLEQVKDAGMQAKVTFDHEVRDHQTARVAVDFGSDAIKKLAVGPDAFCQLAMQLAFYRLHARCPATYEACSTRSFLHGRTETIRACSIESEAFVRAMVSLAAPKRVYTMLRQAADQHRRYAAECSRGMGIDRHLLGLKLCVKPGEAVPAVFNDEAFKRSSTWELSTSHLPSEHFESWGFGEVAREGLGCGYSCNRAETVFFVTCRALPGVEPPDRAQAFAASIQQAMQDMARVCRSARAASSKL